MNKKEIFGITVGARLFFMMLMLTLLNTASADWKDAKWERTSIGGGSTKRYLFDVNNDGYLDSVSITHWYENPGDGSGSWTGYSIGNTDYPSTDGKRVGDVNGDGWPDLVIGVGRKYPAPDRNRIYAFINPKDAGTWTRHHIGTLPDAPDGVETVAIGDLNNDGYPDILAGGECKQLRWYVNPGGSMTTNWNYHILGENFIDGQYLLLHEWADVEGTVVGHFNDDDGDGVCGDDDDYLDVAITACSPNGICGGTYVLMNPASPTPTGNWDCVTLSEGTCTFFNPFPGSNTGKYSCIESIGKGDIDGDGWNDIVLADRRPYDTDINSTNGDSRLYWYQNPQGTGLWTQYEIGILSTNHLSGYPPEIVDVDLDGDSDVICYSIDGGTTYWYENYGGGVSWTNHPIYGVSMNNYAVGDVDNDNDRDIICDGYWYVNPIPGPFTLILLGGRLLHLLN